MHRRMRGEAGAVQASTPKGLKSGKDIRACVTILAPDESDRLALKLSQNKSIHAWAGPKLAGW